MEIFKNINLLQEWKRNSIKDPLIYMTGFNLRLKLPNISEHIDLFKTEKYKDTKNDSIKYFFNKSNTYFVIKKDLEKPLNISFDFGPEFLEPYELVRAVICPINSKIPQIKQTTSLEAGKNSYKVDLNFSEKESFKELYFGLILDKYNRENPFKLISSEFVLIKIINSDFESEITIKIDNNIVLTDKFLL